MKFSNHQSLQFKNVSNSTVSGFKQLRFDVTIFPDAEKARSDGTLVAEIHKYCCANWQSSGNQESFSRHHVRGSTLCGTGSTKYNASWSILQRILLPGSLVDGVGGYSFDNSSTKGLFFALFDSGSALDVSNIFIACSSIESLC